MSEPTPRDVIVNTVNGIAVRVTFFGHKLDSIAIAPEQTEQIASAILDALDQAGFQVTPKPLEIDGDDSTDDLITQARG